MSLGDDPTLPEIQRDPTAPVLLAEPFETPADRGSDQPDEATPFAVRMDAWRRHYLPLPDEVVHEYLGEDEYVVHTDHPSFRAFLLKNGFQVIGLGAVGLMFLIFARGGIDWWTILIFLVLQLILAFLALKRLSDRYTSYVITNLRLIRLSGIFGRKLASIPWTRMTGLGYRQKPVGRLLGYATIFIESANEESGLREFSDINDPAAFHQKILDMMSAKSGQSTKEPPPATRGIRKGFMQRRRERRQLSEERARRAYDDTGPRRPVRGSSSDDDDAVVESLRDTGGVYDALSPSDSDSGSDTGRDAAAKRSGPAAPPPKAPPPPPMASPRPSRPLRPTVEPAAGPRRGRLWPGAQAGPKPRPAQTPAQTPAPAPAARRQPPPQDRDLDRDRDRDEGPQPDLSGVRFQSQWVTGEEPPLVPPERPAAPSSPPPKRPEPEPEVEAELVEDDDDVEDPEPRRPRSTTHPSARWSIGRRRSAPADEPESALDALASLRRGHRPVQPVRRPRLPSFGRRPPRTNLPESRQLPAASDDTPDDPPPDEGGSS